MNAKNIPLILLSFLLLILLINVVNAREDFVAAALPSIGLCPCSNQAYAVTVENTGTLTGSYTVLASGDATEWVTFKPDRFTLNPRQKGSFFVFVNSDCNIEGDYELEIFITTSNGLTKVVKQVLKFSDCYNYSLELGNVIDKAEESIKFLQHDNYYTLCKNEQKIIPILITNNENFENKYRLFLDAPEWAELNVNNVRLGAKKSGIFLIKYDTTNVLSDFNFKLNAISELGKVQRKKNIEVNIQDCYALELDLEKEKDVICGGEDKSYDVILKNVGTLEQNIKLELDALGWANIENASFHLNPEQEKIVILNVNPGDDVSGSFLVNAVAILENKSRLAEEIKIDVVPKFECYKAAISTKTSVTNLYVQDFFSAKVKNNGIKKAAYDVSLEGPSWISASPETLELNPGQIGNINLNVDPGSDIEPGTYGVKINLESNEAVYSKNVDIVLKKESEFVKKLKATIKFYQYYIYLLILIIILIIVFRKPLNKFRKNIKKDYEKYKIKQERLRALRLARKEREEEKKKKREQEEKKKQEEKARKKGLEKKKKERKPFKKFHINKVLVCIIVIIAAIVYIGHQNKLFNAKYLHIYIRNIFVGYLYYILIGVGVVVVLFLLLLFYNYISRRKKKRKVKEVKKAEKKVKGKKQYILYFIILTFILIGILIYVVAYFGLFNNIKEFFILYQYYMVLGILILVILIFLIRFYKPLFKFLRE